MKRSRNLLLIFLLLNINLSAQIVYDTIPDNEVIFGGHGWDKLFIFKDFNSQALTYFDRVDFKKINCSGEKVVVSTIFGKDGKLKNTRVEKSANPICDSIAFYFVHSLKDWLPGLQRGKFVDIPFTFPIAFDSLRSKNMSSKSYLFFNAIKEEYRKRKEYFEFVNSPHYEQEIINEFDLFKKYLAEVFSDSAYVSILTEYKLKKNESVKLSFNYPINKFTHLLLRDGEKSRLLYEYSLKRNKVNIPGDKELLLIIYEEGPTPLLQIEIIHPHSDTLINRKLENYSKGRLLDEIKKYSP